MGRDQYRGEKVYTLAYPDDVVLTMEKEGEMRSMMEILEGYLDKKKLTSNAKKTKIMRMRSIGMEVCARGRKKEIVLVNTENSFISTQI